MGIPTDTDPNKWDRFFAIECNNRAWDLAAHPREPQEALEMLNAAHASAWHWSKVGTELHQMRARMLLARVHALLGYGQSAYEFATQVRDYFAARETEAWELAFTHAIYAHAAYILGKREEHRAAYQSALAALAQITHEGEREHFRETFDLIPKP